MKVTELLTIIERIRAQFGDIFGPMISAIVGRIITRNTTIEYTPEQTASFVENELKALAYQHDDRMRAEGETE